MPVLYVENVPKELYEALRAQARKRRTSIAAEMIELLKNNFPPAAEIQRRKRAGERRSRRGARDQGRRARLSHPQTPARRRRADRHVRVLARAVDLRSRPSAHAG